MRRSLYRTGSLLGWVRAARRGPVSIIKRMARVELYKAFTKLVRALIP